MIKTLCYYGWFSQKMVLIVFGFQVPSSNKSMQVNYFTLSLYIYCHLLIFTIVKIYDFFKDFFFVSGNCLRNKILKSVHEWILKGIVTHKANQERTFDPNEKFSVLNKWEIVEKVHWSYISVARTFIVKFSYAH